eukprot:scaffold3952_cov116-Isochrysis_galbana.AAC.6
MADDAGGDGAGADERTQLCCGRSTRRPCAPPALSSGAKRPLRLRHAHRTGAPFAHGGADSEERAAPVAAARMGRLTTIRHGAAVMAGLPSGAIGGAMAGTPPDRGAGALVTPHRPAGSAGPRTTRRVGTIVAARMAPADFARASA